MSNRLKRSEWRVSPIPQHGEARRLVKAWHYSGSSANTSTYKIRFIHIEDQWKAHKP